MSTDNQKSCDACAKRAEDAFAREVDDELRQERLTGLWRRYRWAFYGIIAALILGTAGFEVYRSWHAQVRLRESDAFEQAAVAAAAGENDAALAALNDLAQSARTGYRYLARMEMAGLLLRGGKTAEGLEILDELRQTRRAPKGLRALAALAFVGHQADAGSPEELRAVLRPLLTDASFAPAAAELTAVLFIRDGQKAQAVDVLRQTAQMPVAPEMRERLNGILSVLEKE